MLFGLPIDPRYQIIPPKMESFTSYSYCTPDCTKHLPADGITVYSVLEHAHLTGRRMYLRHFRDGKQLPDIVSDETYDSHYQVSM